jgi:hypothetical protein
MDAYLLYTAIQVLWIIIGAVWLGRRRDELPLIASVFLFYVFSFRFWALLLGWATSVNLESFGLKNVTLDAAMDCLALGVLGQTVFLIVYCLTQSRVLVVPRELASHAVLDRIRAFLFPFMAVIIASALMARAWVGTQVSAGKSLAFEVSSYVSLLPLALIGIAILLAALWRGGIMNDFFTKAAATLAFMAVAGLTFQSSLRFQFLGWLVACTIIVASGKSVLAKSAILCTGLVAAATMFAVAGALRSANDPDADLEQNAWERFAFAQDANMLDGFVLLRQVYPDLLNYSYGEEHLEILERPIPRAWWPNKPVGGYMNKLGITDANTGFTLGISPSLFGSFYQEGAVPGVILLSAIYGYLLGRLVRYTAGVLPFTALLIRGCTFAALIPLLRGGDLPGIYAWFGMSFWPVALVFILNRRELFRRQSPSRLPAMSSYPYPTA